MFKDNVKVRIENNTPGINGAEGVTIKFMDLGDKRWACVRVHNKPTGWPKDRNLAFVDVEDLVEL